MLTNEDYAKAFHEIKNAITIVSGSIQLLEKLHPEFTDYEYWMDSREALDYLKEVVHELSQTSFTTNFSLQPVNPNSLLKSVLITIQGLRFKNDFDCKCSIVEDLPQINADSIRLTQAIINLIKNGYEAMNESGTILLDAYQDNNQIRIDITDFGGGLSAECQNQIFSPFFTSKPNGTGLGLVITQQIVEGHNGSLKFESRENDGCTFSIILPILNA